LRNDHIDPVFGCLDSLTDRRDLHHDERADIVGLLDQIARIILREGDDGRPGSQSVAKGFNIQGLRDVVYREIAVRQGRQ